MNKRMGRSQQPRHSPEHSLLMHPDRPEGGQKRGDNIARDAVIRWAFVSADYRQRAEPDDIVGFLGENPG